MMTWDEEFIESIYNYSKILSRLRKHCMVVFHKTIKDWILDDPYEFPHTENHEIEIGLINLTWHVCIEHMEDIPFFIFELKAKHAFFAFIYIIYKIILLKWYNIIHESKLLKNSYSDLLIRSRIMGPLNFGIGYFSLLVAKNVQLNSTLRLHIDVSRDLSPELPYTSDEKRDLIKIAGSENHLRLALLIAQEFSHNKNMHLTLDNTQSGLFNYLYMSTSEELEIFIECIFQSKS